MTRTSRQEQSELRAKVKEAIDFDILAPSDIIEYILDNGWRYEMPTRPTIIAILKENGVEYKHGGWERVR